MAPSANKRGNSFLKPVKLVNSRLKDTSDKDKSLHSDSIYY